MDELELATAYEQARPRLIRVAYAILGNHAEAQDVAAECWLRLAVANADDPVRDVLGWGTVAVARAALDVLRSARARRESYVGPWLPEPVVTTGDPADQVTLAESVHFALMVALERLTPPERTAWVLHEVFAMPYAEIADVVGRRPDAVRQLAHRARAHLAAGSPRMDVDPTEHNQVVTAFTAAARAGDLTALIATLDPQVTLTGDGGGAVSAARRPVHGAERVARFIVGGTNRTPVSLRTVTVNGLPGLAVTSEGALRAVVALTVADGLVTRLDLVLNPDKLVRPSHALTATIDP